MPMVIFRSYETVAEIKEALKKLGEKREPDNGIKKGPPRRPLSLLACGN
jgi:hypothetical protein